MATVFSITRYFTQMKTGKFNWKTDYISRVLELISVPKHDISMIFQLLETFGTSTLIWKSRKSQQFHLHKHPIKTWIVRSKPSFFQLSNDTNNIYVHIFHSLSTHKLPYLNENIRCTNSTNTIEIVVIRSFPRAPFFYLQYQYSHLQPHKQLPPSPPIHPSPNHWLSYIWARNVT